MSDLSSLLLLLLLAGTAGLWMKLSAARELAVREARHQCLQHGLQLLDETVGLQSVRLRRVHGQRRIERCYGFEVSIDGQDRQPGRLYMIGNALGDLSLPSLQQAPDSNHDTTAIPAAPVSNVVTLHAHRRQRDRLH